MPTCPELEDAVTGLALQKEASRRKNTHLPRFDFDFMNNKIDGSDHAIDVLCNISASDCSDFAKAYSAGKIGFVLPLKSTLCDCVSYLLFTAAVQHDGQSVFDVTGLDVGHFGADYRNHGHDDLVLRGVTQFVNCREESTPSRVGLITGKKPLDLFRESLTNAVYATFEATFGAGEREVHLVGGKVSKPRNVAGGKIESSSQIFDGVNCELCKSAWDRFKESEFVPFVSAARIRLDAKFAWCSLEVDIAAPYKIGKAFLSPLDTKTRIAECGSVAIAR